MCKEYFMYKNQKQKSSAYQLRRKRRFVLCSLVRRRRKRRERERESFVKEVTIHTGFSNEKRRKNERTKERNKEKKYIFK